MLKRCEKRSLALLWGALASCALWGPLTHAQPTPTEDDPPVEPFDPNQQQDQQQHPALTPPPATPPAKEGAEKPGAKPADPAENHPGRLLFRQAVTALGKVRSMSYHVSTSGTGAIASHAIKIEADVKMARAPRAVLPGWHLHTKGVATTTEGEATEFDVAWLDSTIEWVDTAAKLVVERAQAEARRGHPEVTRANQARFDEFINTQPFKRELTAAEYTIEDRATVGGVECDVVLVKATKTALPVRWWIGVDDHLPRKSEAIFAGSLQGTRVSEVTNLKASPDNDSIPPAALRVTVPEGFHEDRAAPPATPPRPAAPIAKPATTPGPDSKPVADTKPPAPVAPPTRFAPEFELTDIAGAKVTLASLKGKVIVAEFAGSWSLGLPEARQEFQTLLDRYKDQPVSGLSFAVREKTKDGAIEEYHKKQFSFDLLLEADSVAKSFGVSGYPSYAVIGPEGELLVAPAPFQPADTMTGMADEVDAALSKLNGTPPPHKHAKAAAKSDTKPDAKADAKPEQAKAPTPEKPATAKAATTPAPAKPTNVGTKARPVPQPRPGTTPSKPDTDH